MNLLSRSLWSFVGGALPTALILILTPALVAKLGISGFGALMLVMLVPSIAAHLDFGLGAAALRELSLHVNDPNAMRRTLGQFTALLAVAALVVAAAVVVFAPLMLQLTNVELKQASVALHVACAGWAALSVVLLGPVMLARAVQALRLLAVSQTLNTAGLWLGAWALVSRGLPFWTVAALGSALAVVQATAQLLTLRTHWRPGHRPIAEPSGGELGGRLRFAAGVMALQGASALFYHGDRYLVSAISGFATGGAYAAVVNIANKIQSATGALVAFLYPHFSALEGQHRHEEIRKIVNVAERMTWLIVAPALVPTAALAKPFIHLWLGEQGSNEMALALVILVAGFSISATAGPIGHALLARGDSRMAAAFAWLTVATMLILLSLLAPSMGLVGAAAAMATASSTSILFQAAARRQLRMRRDPTMRRDALSIAAGVGLQIPAALLLSPLASSWLMLAVTGTSVWVSFFLARGLLGILATEERALLAKLRARLAHTSSP